MVDLPGRSEDRLPWLQEAEDEDPDRDHGFLRMIGVMTALFVGVMLIVVLVWWFLLRDGAIFGSGQLIRAPETPYREKPADAGGMKVEGTGDLAYRASEGQDVDSAIDLNAMPEQPVAQRPAAAGGGAGAGAGAGANAATASADGIVIPGPTLGARAAAAPKAVAGAAAPAPAPVAPRAAAPAPATTTVPATAPAPAPRAAGGGSIQLGAFSTQAKAQAAWKSLSGRFGFLGPLANSVVAVKSGEQTLYRLRADAGGEAASICQRLKVAGETCSVVG